MDEVELHPWHERTSTHDAWDLLGGPASAAHDLRAWLEQPGGQARLRAALEPELGTGAELHDAALLCAAADLLDQGRLVLEAATVPDVPVDPHHVVGDGTDELGDLLDLLEEEPAANDDGEPSPAEPPRPTWIEITVVDGRGEPITGRPYRLHLPDGSVRSGVLGDDGVIRFDDVDPGLCTLELPTADAAEWAPPGAIAA